MTRWLVTGATGLLGANALRSLGDAVTGIARRVPVGDDRLHAIDLFDPAQCAGLVERFEADVVVHAAAVSSIEGCERDPVAARRLNVEVAHELATQSARHGSRFIYISTDAVFDGVGGRYAVGDPTSPTSEYGRSKVAGERATLDADPTAIVARVNFYGWSPTGTRSVAEFFYHRLARGEVTPGFTDVVVSTIEVTLLVNALAELAIGHARGIQHVVSSESISKFDLGRRIATEFGFDEGLVEPAASSEHLSVARGADLSLDTTATAEALGRAMPGQAEGITLLREEFDAGIPAALALLAPDRPANRLLFPRTAGT